MSKFNKPNVLYHNRTGTEKMWMERRTQEYPTVIRPIGRLIEDHPVSYFIHKYSRNIVYIFDLNKIFGHLDKIGLLPMCLVGFWYLFRDKKSRIITWLTAVLFLAGFYGPEVMEIRIAVWMTIWGVVLYGIYRSIYLIKVWK